MSTFAYPWDLRRLGVERSLEQMAAAGFDALYLAANYHPIDALSPRDGRLHLFASGRGAVHFPAGGADYGRIRPAVSTPDICAVWPEVADLASSVGLALVPWVIVLYQPWIVDAHPECARVLPSGDAIDAGVCPANDDVRQHVVALCDDLVEQFGTAVLHLEGPSPAAFDYGWLRPRVLVDLPRLARELLALCFCPSCCRRGADAGLDVDRLQALVNHAIAVEAGLESTGALAHGSDLLAEGELQAFVELFLAASDELADAVKRSGDAQATRRLSGMVWTPFSMVLGERRDALFDAALRPFDQVIVSSDANDRRTRVAVAGRDSRGLELTVLLTPGLGGTSDAVDEVLGGAREIGAAEVALYNYGLLRESDVRSLTRQVRERTDAIGAEPIGEATHEHSASVGGRRAADEDAPGTGVYLSAQVLRDMKEPT